MWPVFLFGHFSLECQKLGNFVYILRACRISRVL